MSEERRICAAKPIKPISRPLGLATQPLELAASPADDIEIDPLQGRTQLRPVEVAVVVDPALNVRVVGLSQILQGFVAVMMKGPAPDRPADGRQRLRAGCRHEAVRGALSTSSSSLENMKPRKSNDWLGKSPRRFASL